MSHNVLFFAPIRQDPPILSLFLKALRHVRGIDQYLFIDDNDDEQSSKLLEWFKSDFEDQNEVVRITPSHVLNLPPRGSFPRSGPKTHEWNETHVARLTKMRNLGLMWAQTKGFAYLFTADSDLILPPSLVETLLDTQKPIISEVYWSKWSLNFPWMPQVCDQHPYLFDSPESITRFASPELGRVNGLGGCTLISLTETHSYLLGYNPIPGVDMLGEDKHFCIRASALPIELWADSYDPPFHVYRPAQLKEAQDWYDQGCNPHYFRQNWLTHEWKASVLGEVRC